MPQWLLAARCEVVAANLRKIEKGVTQPSITLAVRLLMATGADVGSCMTVLAYDAFSTVAAPDKPLLVTSCNKDVDDSFRSALVQCHEETCFTKHVFGRFLKEARTFYGVSQKKLAESANYHLRNMLEVESGRRDPSVMTALAMVFYTGCNVGIFFDTFTQCLANRAKNT